VPHLILSRFEHTVTSKNRKRGEACARSGSVTLQERSSIDEPVEAVVAGSDRCFVTIRYADQALWGGGTCSYFARYYGVCPHIWATFIECESKKVEFPGD
jgi:uncharacterized Zn finger protein